MGVEWTSGEMRKIKSANLAQLLMQLRFTPEPKRRAQLEAAERLHALIEDGRQYPYDFVCFHITGYNPKTDIEQESVQGRDLRDDLQIFIAKLSGRLAVPAAQAGEKVYTIDELTTQFNVSTKTINRWRKKGLLARKFIFDGGTRRLGFLESTVARFAQENPELVANARSFRRLTGQQRQQVLPKARPLTTHVTVVDAQRVAHAGHPVKLDAVLFSGNAEAVPDRIVGHLVGTQQKLSLAAAPGRHHRLSWQHLSRGAAATTRPCPIR